MKTLLSCCVFLIVLNFTLAQEVNKENDKEKMVKVRRGARQCVQLVKIPFAIAVSFGNGEFVDDKPASKCFLKCFAEKLELYDYLTNQPNTERLIEYAYFMKPSNKSYNEFINSCFAEIQRNEDLCDYSYQFYKCFWDKIKNDQQSNTPQLSPKDTDKERQVKVRRASRICVQQEKVTFSVVAAYGKGDMKDESQKSKCFLKCFAENLELYSNVTGDPDKEKLIEYINYLKPSNMPYPDYVDSCLAQEQRSEDMCDYVYRCYKCFWDKIKSQPEPESVRLSFYDVLGFNTAFDEGEIIQEEVYKVVDEEDKTNSESADATHEVTLKSAV